MTTDAGPLFVLVAGEASGDQLGAGLIEKLRDRFPKAQFAGIGGPRMAASGMQLWHRSERLSVMGIFEVLKHLPELLSIRRDVYKRTVQSSPAVFIGIDAPDFNLGLERKLKRVGIRTVHYVSPSIWAWREKRMAKIGRSADRLLCLFPMEPSIYAKYDVDARFVGHPLADAFAVQREQGAARRELGLSLDVPILALLPGSRINEIRQLGSDFLRAAILLNQQFPNLQFIAPMANPACRKEFEQLVAAQSKALPSLHIVAGQAQTAMIAADAVLLASGTAALETMLAKRPMVVAYRLAPMTYRLIRWLGMMRTNVYSLPNILAGEPFVTELMQDACTPAALADAIAPYLSARTMPASMLSTFNRIHKELGRDANQNAANAVAELLEATPLLRSAD
jgi:lipid-A-disaccharide synthase